MRSYEAMNSATSLRNAIRCRWCMLIVGVETDYRLVARSTEPIGIIVGVQPGQRAQIIVQAVNNNMQGVASDPIIFTVVLGTQMKTKKSPAATEPKGLAVNEEAMAAATDGGKTRSKENRLPTLT